MSQILDYRALPLHYQTPLAWGEAIQGYLPEVLVDHAHLERKAAVNALDLFNRFPLDQLADRWSSTLAIISQDESVHLKTVLRLMKKRNIQLPRFHKNPYANSLHQFVRRGKGQQELLDRLMVSALIEVRSCERFGILAECCNDEEIARLYHGLWASEFGHFNAFLQLAGMLVDESEVESSWQTWLTREGEVMQAQAFEGRLHSGAPSGGA